MPFNSDKQRKAFFAKGGNLRSKTIPSISGRIGNIKEKLRQRKERIEKEHFEKQKKLLKQEQEQTKKLKAEAHVALEREHITQQREQAKKELKELKQKKFERSFIGKVGKSFKDDEERRRAWAKTPKGRRSIKQQEQGRKKIVTAIFGK